MHITLEQERQIIEAFLAKLQLSERHAKITSDVVSHSDFTGVYSHGLSRFLMYVQQYSAGALNANPNIHKISDFGATSYFDCDHASGVIAVNEVYDATLEKAKEFGIGIGVGKEASNIGCGNYYGWRAAKDNMLAIVMSNTFPAMAPFGGADRLIGTNPIIMACPAGKSYPLVLDISTSNVAMGKIMAFRREGKEIPLGWANDINGVPTKDPSQAYAVTPIGTYKGYGLAVFVDILGAVLSGSKFGSEIPSVHALQNENTGFTVILVDISKFMPIEDFKARVDEYVDMMKNSRKADGFNEIFMPGELEYRHHADYLENGLDVSDATMKELHKSAVSLGIITEEQSLLDLCK